MNNWSKRYNALSKETRMIASAVGDEQRIRDLERTKERLKNNCAAQCAEIRGLIKRLQQGIDRMEGADDG